MALIDCCTPKMGKGFKWGMIILGWILTVGLYVLLTIHVFAYFAVIAKVLKRRMGANFGLLWCGIGLCLLYNIVYNHFFAMIIKPGSPRDLQYTEWLRK